MHAQLLRLFVTLSVVGHSIACAGCSRSVVGPCIACSLRSHVAPAPEVFCFAPLSIVMKQEPRKAHTMVYIEVTVTTCLKIAASNTASRKAVTTIFVVLKFKISTTTSFLCTSVQQEGHKYSPGGCGGKLPSIQAAPQGPLLSFDCLLVAIVLFPDRYNPASLESLFHAECIFSICVVLRLHLTHPVASIRISSSRLSRFPVCWSVDCFHSFGGSNS